MKKILILLLSFPFCLQAAFSLHDAHKWLNTFQNIQKPINTITNTLPAKIQAARTAVTNYKAKKCTVGGKKLSDPQCLALALSAISEALSTFTYPALGNWETKTFGLTWEVLKNLGYDKAKKGSMKRKAYLSMLKAIRELSGAIEAMDVLSFLLYPARQPDKPTPTLTTAEQAELDALDDLDLDDID